MVMLYIIMKYKINIQTPDPLEIYNTTNSGAICCGCGVVFYVNRSTGDGYGIGDGFAYGNGEGDGFGYAHGCGIGDGGGYGYGGIITNSR